MRVGRPALPDRQGRARRLQECSGAAGFRPIGTGERHPENNRAEIVHSVAVCEALLLSLFGSAAGFLLASWLTPRLSQMAWRGSAAIDLNVSSDSRVLALVLNTDQWEAVGNRRMCSGC